MARTEAQELWGAETSKAVENFPVSGEPIPAPVAAVGRLRKQPVRGHEAFLRLGVNVCDDLDVPLET